MAKRKRLMPARPGPLDDADESAPASRRPLAIPPIAQVAAESSTTAALAEVSAELMAARTEGRMIEALALEEIDDTHLMRDRLVLDEDEMSSLMSSLQGRGQQIPIEVVRLPAPVDGRRFGLISGWRRVTALRRLSAQTGEARFGVVRAMIVTPQTAPEAYVAMVEENEVRVGLSFYERARIAWRGVEAGVFPDRRAALRELYGSATRSKRSKIGSFMSLVEAFDGVLSHPTAISEKLGLSLAKAVAQHPDFVAACRLELQARPARSDAEEMRILTRCVSAAGKAAPKAARPAKQADDPVVEGIHLAYRPADRVIALSGPGVTAELSEDLGRWLMARAAKS